MSVGAGSASFRTAASSLDLRAMTSDSAVEPDIDRVGLVFDLSSSVALLESD